MDRNSVMLFEGAAQIVFTYKKSARQVVKRNVFVYILIQELDNPRTKPLHTVICLFATDTRKKHYKLGVKHL